MGCWGIWKCICNELARKGSRTNGTTEKGASFALAADSFSTQISSLVCLEVVENVES